MLGQIVVTEQQKMGLAYLAEQYERMNSGHAVHLSKLFRRLIDDSPIDRVELVVPLFPAEPGELAWFDLLQGAMASCRKVDVFGKCDSRPLRLSPYKLYTYRRLNYVVGYCEPAGQIRFFGLHDIERVVPTDEPFDLTPLLRQAYVIPEMVPEPEKAVVWFGSEAYAEGMPFAVRRLGEGLFELDYYNEDQLLAALFLLPCRSAVVTPEWLKGRFTHLLERKMTQQLDHDILCPTPPGKLELSSDRRMISVAERG